jgi:REP element-mobilizing transposase RayT
MGQALGLVNVNAVRGHLAALEKKGYITRAPDKARSIQVVHAPSAISRIKRKFHELFRTDEGVVHKVLYGLGWTTRNREPILVGPQKERIEAALEQEAVEHGWTLHHIQIQPDYVMVVVQVWPNHSPQQAVHRFQNACAGICGDEASHPGQWRWGKGFVATTFLEQLEDMIRELLQLQTAP